MNKKAQLKFVLVLLLVGVLFFGLVLAGGGGSGGGDFWENNKIKDYDGNMVDKNSSYVYQRTATREIIKNPDGTRTTTLGGQKFIDDETRRFPNYVPVNSIVKLNKTTNPTNGKSTEEILELKLRDSNMNLTFVGLNPAGNEMPTQSANGIEVIINETGNGYKWGYKLKLPNTKFKARVYVESDKDFTYDEFYIYQDDMVLSFDDVLDYNYTRTLYVQDNQTAYYEIGRDWQADGFKNNDLIWIDPSVVLQDADTENLKDSFVAISNIEGGGEDNFGGTNGLYIASNLTGAYLKKISYISFNISSIPDSIVSDAELHLFEEYRVGAFVNVSIFYLYNDWTNGTGSNILGETDLTWNNQPCGLNFDNSTNCNLTEIDKQIVNSSHDFEWVYFDVTVPTNYLISNDQISFSLKPSEWNTDNTLIFSSKESTTTSERPKLNITYTPYIDIISPTPAQIFTENQPTTYFNVSTGTDMDECRWSEDSGVTNYTLTSVNSTFFTLANTSMVDGAHTIVYYCNQSSDGTWRTSDSVSFDVDSVNVTVCRDLTVAGRDYILKNDLYDTGSCIKIMNNSINFDGEMNEISSDYSFSGAEYCMSIWGYDNATITNTKFLNCSYGAVSFVNNGGFSINNSIFNNSRIGHIRMDDTPGAVVKNISFYRNGDAMLLEDTSRNGVFSNLFYDGEDRAFYFSYGGYDNIIRDSNLTTSGGYIINSDYDSEFPTEVGYNNTFLNCSYDDSKENIDTNNNITRKWYFQTQVNNSAGYLENALVNIYDKDSNLISSELTDATGSIGREELIEYVNNGGTKAYETPHTIEISKADYTTNSTVYNLTSETNVYHPVTLIISETAPISILKSPVDWYNSSSLTNTLICNSTDDDGNLKNVTVKTWLSGSEESTQTKSVTGSANSTEFTNFGFTGQNTYEWNCYVCDEADNCDWGTNRTIYLDTNNPDVSHISPANETNTTESSQNLTASFADGRGIKNATLYIYNSTDDEINQTTTTFSPGETSTVVGIVYTFVDGLFTWFWDVFDWSGNSDTESNYTIQVDATAPIVTIIHPEEGVYYNYQNHTINITESDNYAGLNTCWYTNDSGLNNYTYTCGNNVSANLSEGDFTYSVYANDTFGNIGSDSVHFYISVGPPAINLNYPFDGAYFNSGTDIYLNFTATDSDGLDTCKLYGNWSGSWLENYTWISPNSGAMNSTSINITAGGYKWGIWCNDTLGIERTSLNRTFVVDLTFPEVIHSHISSDIIYNDDAVTIYGNISDDYLSEVWIEINSTGEYNNVTVTTHSGDMYIYGLSASEVDNFENISWYWHTNDSAGNENSSEINSFEVSNRNPYNITITNPLNASYINSPSIIVNFSSYDEDSDTMNYSLYNSSDGTSFSLFNSTTNSYINFTGFNTSEGVTNYIYVVANDSELSNQSDNYSFIVDLQYPLIVSIDYPKPSPLPQCSLLNRDLNYTVSDTNLDYCTFNITSGGIVTTANTIMPGCNNISFNNSLDGAVQLLSFSVVDLAGNSNTTEILIYFDTDNELCPSSNGGTSTGGGSVLVQPSENVSYCGDGTCNSERGESFYNCPEDCAPVLGDFSLDALFFNCISEDPEIRKDCIWINNPGLWLIFGFMMFIFLFTVLFEYKPKESGSKKFKFRLTKPKKRRR